MFHAKVLVERTSGRRTWELPNNTANYNRKTDLTGYLAEAGRNNEKEFRRLITKHCMRSFGIQGNLQDGWAAFYAQNRLQPVAH
jgi:hypothetical protein